MFTRIVLKSSDLSGAFPEPEDLAPGELSLNTADAELFLLREDDIIKRLAIAEAIELKMGASTTLNDSTTGTQFSNFTTPPAINTDPTLYDAVADGVDVSRGGIFLVAYNMLFETGGNNRRIRSEVTLNGSPVGGGNTSYSINNAEAGLSGTVLLSAAEGDRIGLRTTRVRNTGTMTTVAGAGGMRILRVGV